MSNSDTSGFFIFDFDVMPGYYGHYAFKNIYECLCTSKGTCGFNDGDLAFEHIRELAKQANHVQPIDLPNRKSPLTNLNASTNEWIYAIGMWTDEYENFERLHSYLNSNRIDGYLGYFILKGVYDRTHFNRELRISLALTSSIIIVNGKVVSETSKYVVGYPLSSLDQELLNAAEKGDVHSVEKCLAQGANVNCESPNDRGETPLMKAVEAKCTEAVKILLQHGADPNINIGRGITVLMIAARRSIEIVKLLLEYGANVNAQNTGGDTAMTYAKAAGHSEIIRVLHEYGGVDGHDYTLNIEQSKTEDTYTPSVILNNLGIELLDRYLQTGDPRELDKCIEICKQSVEQIEYYAPEAPIYLNTYGRALRERYIRLGIMEDLELSISLFAEAVSKAIPEKHDLPIFLHNFGVGLRDRYQRTDNLDDLDQSIVVHSQAIVKANQNDPTLSLYFNSFSMALFDRFQRNGEVEDLNRAIDSLKTALATATEDAREIPIYLNNLGIVLRSRFLLFGVDEDLENAIHNFQQAIRKTSENSPSLSGFLENLATGLRSRYDQVGSLKDLEHAVMTYEKATKIGLDLNIAVGFQAASSWMKWAFSREAWEEVERAYGYIRQASEQVLKIQLLRHNKEIWLKESQGLATQVAYAMTKRNELEKAAVTIEMSLAQLLSEALARDRANLERLKTMGYSDLYERYQNSVEQWHHLTRKNQRFARNNPFLQKAHEELEAAIYDIRKVDGYENFFAEITFSDILTAAENSPLVYIITTDAGGLALIVGYVKKGRTYSAKNSKNDNISAIWLPKLTTKNLRKVLNGIDGDSSNNGYLSAYSNWQTDRNDEYTLEVWLSVLEDTTRWLWDAIIGPIMDSIPSLRKLALIPIGSLNLLPLHAAWAKDETRPTGKRYAIDILTISYTPNARALVEAQALVPNIKRGRLLAIDEPILANTMPLPNSKYEVQFIASNFENPKLLRHSAATRDAVLKNIPSCDVLHFSCHGFADLENPLSSGLAMSDRQFISLDDLLKLRLDGIRLATLSACETGIPGIKLPNEVVNLPSGLLQAGTSGVVSSLWSVLDLSTMILMVHFYDLWCQKNVEPSQALCQAQQWLRDSTINDKITYFEQLSTNFYQASDSAFSRKSLAEEIKSVLSNFQNLGLDFTHPFYWAGFTYTGV